MFKALCILILPGLLAGSGQAAERRLLLEKVDVTGSQRLPSAFLERELHLTPGVEVTEDELTADRNRLLGTGLFQSVQFFLSKGETPGHARLRIELVDDPGVFGTWAWGGSLGLTQDQSASESLGGELNPLSARAQLISRNLFNSLHRASGAVDYDSQGIMRGFHVAYGFPRFSKESVQFDARMEAADAQARYLDILGFGSRGQAYWTFDQDQGTSVQYGLAIYMNNRGQRFSLPGFPRTLIGPKLGLYQENRLLSFRPSEGYAYGASVILNSQGLKKMGYELEGAVTKNLWDDSHITAQVQGLSVGFESLSYRSSVRWEQPLPILEAASDPGIYLQFMYGADHYKEFRYEGREARLGLRFHSAGLIADIAVAFRTLPESMKDVLEQEWEP
ncbi:hypothetical protein [Oligoflexus tunisiensis]|uniref:hypothetical protein n=1 Tax=Oligoflexus tunisiensis TaxID=708132 RepID=UPI00114CA221|nr:hypothetical protein [Oligoflexus tunisiensis]